jgi:hypothetical protein
MKTADVNLSHLATVNKHKLMTHTMLYFGLTAVTSYYLYLKVTADIVFILQRYSAIMHATFKFYICPYFYV